MKVLITGACGHIGSFLSENIHKIKGVSRGILVDNLKSNRFNSLYNFEKKNNLSFFLRDLNNLNILNDFVISNKKVVNRVAAKMQKCLNFIACVY
mgnify:CR=1 FL=1